MMKKIITSFLLAVALLFVVSCKKEETPTIVAPTPAAPTFLDSANYLKFTLGSQSFSYVAPQNGIWSAGSDNLSQGYYKQWSTIQQSNWFTISITDTTSETTSPVSKAYYRNFIKSKSYVFSTVNFLNFSNFSSGVYIEVQDTSGVNWKTVNPNGFSNHNGSYFIINQTAEYEQMSNFDIKYKATFTCKLYNSNGDSTMLTNGEIATSF